MTAITGLETRTSVASVRAQLHTRGINNHGTLLLYLEQLTSRGRVLALHRGFWQ